MHPPEQLRETLLTLELDTLRGPWYRAAQLQFIGTLEDTAHSLRADSRFLPPGLTPSVHLADGPDHAMLEALGLFRQDLGPLVTPAFAVFPVDVDLRRVLDLRQPEVQQALGTSWMELTGDFRELVDQRAAGSAVRVPTQDLGVAALEAGVQALRYPSSGGGRENLVVLTRHTAPERVRARLPQRVRRAAQLLREDEGL